MLISYQDYTTLFMWEHGKCIKNTQKRTKNVYSKGDILTFTFEKLTYSNIVDMTSFDMFRQVSKTEYSLSVKIESIKMNGIQRISNN